VNVYWASTVLAPVPGNEERIGAGARTVAADTPVRASLESLFAGTDSIETEIGMSSLIPAGTRVLGIAVDGTTATVDLSGEFENSIGGTLAESMQIAQVVFTVTQFDNIDRVRFHIDGEPRTELLSHGFEIGEGLTRDDFANIRPAILVEQPFPGAAVGNPLVIAGESNTFEGTVQFSVLTGGGDGLVVMDGFTTATAGNGTWGTYEAVVELSEFPETYLPGPGSIVVFEISPADGGPTNIVEIPITLPNL
ncbi:MAG: GerMN domain-containing protein, partial [Ilumatobacteraceae bacterium]